MYFTKDVRILFATRITRLFAYGFLSVVLALYLIEAGLSAWQIGMLLALTLAGDAAISLWLTTNADRIGRRRMLTVGAVLMLLAGIVFLITHNPLVLTAAAIVGVISPSGNEIGPFLSIEQAALSQLVADENRTRLFAWYNLAGSFATATGALAGGWLAQSLQSNGWTKLASFQFVLAGYALAGLALAVSFQTLSAAVEVVRTTGSPKRVLGLHKSRSVVLKLSGLFALYVFAGGQIMQSMFALWLRLRFRVNTGVIGSIFWRKHSHRNFRPAGRKHCGTLRAYQHDGVHPHPIQYFSRAGSAHAQFTARNRRHHAALQHFPNGRARPPVLHHGGG